MRTETSKSFLRLQYKAPDYQFGQVELDFELQPHRTIVQSVIEVVPSPHTAASHPEVPLILDGQDLEFISLRVNGQAHRHVEITPERMVIHGLPNKGKQKFQIEIKTSCEPDKNTSLMGLYVSRGNFFTQCEAEGFRKITYFLDRPDVMARYRVTLRARKEEHPVLLSNGNLIASEDLGDGWHQAVWEDPFPKPSYLFALVAGKLVCLEESVQSQSGAQKLLQIWVEPRDLQKTQHAMDSLKSSIAWDEKRFGLELDLERFMIVAVGDFNMGAMENKGLNIFNTKFVLADAQTATDGDYANIESVVAHEYFHNWTGNRVTCRDWFQLSLKEGLTVFRDQEFSADQMGTDSGRAVKRIEDVRLLRQVQFPEDAGPMAHPIRPDEYQEINNFYTVTVYEKGAEVVRMYQTLLGRDGFRKGMDLYFKRHDGQAVTCDEFVAAMADANQRDLTQFKNWYSQAGTPRVTVLENYDAKKKEYRLTLRQHYPKTPGQNKKAPFHIPLKASLLLDKGSKVSQKERAYFAQEVLLELTQAEQSWLVQNISAKPVLSINRDFSAPIILEHKQSEAELLTLLAEDTDPFSRWESAQKLAQQMILAGRLPNTKLIDAYRVILQDPHLDPAFKELIFTLPAETYLYEQCKVVEPQEIHWARRRFKTALAQALQDEWALTYTDYQSSGPYRADAKSMGKRALKNLALMMLLESGDVHWQERAEEQYELANNMSDRFAALQALVAVNAPHAKNALADFYQRFAEDALVIDKWFALQATRPAQIGTSILMDVKALMQHSAFKLNNPNRVRSLIHAFCLNNPAGFHQADGSAYRFWIECVIALDKINPQVAARLARALDRWPKFAKPYSKHMLAALHHVAKAGHLSPDVGEVITKAIAARL
ncbi:aminopeptidase N [Polynucleobacter sp. UK-FUSCHL-C3]|uniref:Aminopeptidase N n=1 Tax=Polynucleobacter sp. UK-FUSCHL-C3 TaxID=2955208 RepID=A0AAU8A1F5_9BURK